MGRGTLNDGNLEPTLKQRNCYHFFCLASPSEFPYLQQIVADDCVNCRGDCMAQQKQLHLQIIAFIARVGKQMFTISSEPQQNAT